MNRRNLFGAALALMAAIGLVGCKDDKAGSEPAAASAAPAQTFHWKMVTAWPKNYPGLGTAAERLADR
ncbi:MAG: ABC transporter substrate-binding protein, partial [Billgrantia sp.]